MRRITIADYNFDVIGDPHLGRRFTTDVPLHRRGDREKMIEADFKSRFENLTGTFHVCMGDIVHTPIVSPATVALVADTYRDAVKRHPDVLFVLITGNHDISRDIVQVNSFDLLERLLIPLGVYVVKDTPLILEGFGFFPWVPGRTAAEVAEGCPPLKAAFGHWDLVNPSSPENLVPLDVIQTEVFVTGHDHRARQVGKVHCTGSMQPYAHGEGEMYRTVTLEELASIPDTKDLCLRLMLREGESVPDDLDALQISVVRQTDISETPIEVGFEGLDMTKLFQDVMALHGVGKDLRDGLFERYRGA